MRTVAGTNAPPFALVEVRTNGVSFASATSNAIVSKTILRRGTSEGGEWIETETPFFRWGTNPVSRVFASQAVLSFGSMRHPALGTTLPDGTPAESLVALRTPLGLVPEANGSRLAAPSRFWHEETAFGRVFTWENALLDRKADRPATVQIETRDDGDFVYRYDFSDAAPTNGFFIGAQLGPAAIEALGVRGGVTNATTVYRVNGAHVPSGVSVADLFAAPSLELRWKSVAGLGNLSGDTDGDGLTDWDELYPFRLHANGATADLSISPATNTPSQRSGPPLRSAPAPFPFWTDDPDGVFDGPSDGGSGGMAVPTLELTWVDPGDGSHVVEASEEICLHGVDEALFAPTISSEVAERVSLDNLTERETNLVLSVPESGRTFSGSISFESGSLEWGSLTAAVSAHRCDSEYAHPYCSVCGHYQPDDLELAFRSPLTTVGDWFSQSENDAVDLSNRPPDLWSDPDNHQAGAIYVVASFHTHPPTATWQPGGEPGRPVGPSEDGDLPTTAALQVPGLVYDYEPEPFFSANWHTNGIPAGWPTNAPARICPVTPPERRPQP